jgi:hypothetical protein
VTHPIPDDQQSIHPFPHGCMRSDKDIRSFLTEGCN